MPESGIPTALPSSACDDPIQELTAALTKFPHTFLQPEAALHTAAIAAAKRYLDPLAVSTIKAQENRRQHTGKRNRKHSEYEGDRSQTLRLREVHTAGFGVAQVWEQAKLVLNATEDELDLALSEFQHQVQGSQNKEKPSSKAGRKVRFKDLVSPEPDVGENQDTGLDHELESEPDEDQSGSTQDEGSEERIEDTDDSEASDGRYRAETFVPDPNGLNDGFFSIDDFNKQSQFLEQKDGMGEDDNPSDEDEVDWDTDPLAVPLPRVEPSSPVSEASDDDGNSSDDGPTFGSVISEESELDEMDLDPNIDNTNEVKYSDFFEPPPEKLSKSKRMRALPKTQPVSKSKHLSEEIDHDLNADLQRAIADVTRDLEDSVSEASESDRNLPTIRPKSAPKANLSTHEKQTSLITAEIARLETAALSKRHWTLAGEALASARPHNSLISEDLDFERLGKPVPVITAEVSTSIEALIKQRILDRTFDEVRRRLPETASTASNARRGVVELNDNKATLGLADEYEAAHLRQGNGDKDTRSAATKKQHAEIKTLWADVSAKLDALSNLHFVPKKPELGVTVIADVPTISMEDARPGAAEGGMASRLAPQELFRVGDGLRKGGDEVLMPDGVRAREELSREEKKRKRKREKEKFKKKTGNEAPQTTKHEERAGGSKGKRGKIREAEKKTILDDLKKGGVKVIGKGGRVEEIESGKKASRGDGAGSAAYKL